MRPAGRCFDSFGANRISNTVRSKQRRSLTGAESFNRTAVTIGDTEAALLPLRFSPLPRLTFGPSIHRDHFSIAVGKPVGPAVDFNVEMLILSENRHAGDNLSAAAAQIAAAE